MVLTSKLVQMSHFMEYSMACGFKERERLARLAPAVVSASRIAFNFLGIQIVPSLRRFRVKESRAQTNGWGKIGRRRSRVTDS